MTAGTEDPTAPLHVSPPSQQPSAEPTPPVAASGGEHCPSCGAGMAPDQRYCLNCGHRRGDPRLPFMDAVVFMDAIKQPSAAEAAPPAPPKSEKAGISPSTTLVAGIATLVLAVGVGVLIGRSGGNGGSQPAAAAPQIIKVGGGGEEAEASSAAGGAKRGKQAKGKSGGSKGKSSKATPEKEVGSSGTSKAAEEVLKPAGDVKLPPPTTQVGEKCEKGTSGCSDSGEFNGDFFGE